MCFNLAPVQVARRTTAEILATMCTSAIFMQPEKYPNPAVSLTDVLKYSLSLGITRADLPLKLKTQIDAILKEPTAAAAGASSLGASSSKPKKDKKDKHHESAQAAQSAKSDSKKKKKDKKVK
jgi:hypothetical protein